ncbi:hypothetical protein K439DRAFT_1541744 [Ramaria rubella]|nr:hypothetical protein K439DRAFT_1541744 [Ramaria rubella]
MPQNNPSGKNGIDNGTWPANEVLRGSLLQYAKEGLQLKDRLCRLGDEHGLYIKEQKLKQLNQKFNIPSVQKGCQHEHAAQLILNKVAADTHRLNGAGYIKMALATEGHLIPRATVRRVILENDPDAVDARYPGQKKIKCTQLTSIGVFDDLGPVSLPIYGFRCKWSGAILHMVVVPNDCLATMIGHVFLDFVDFGISAIPLQITVDQGSETREMFAMQTSLRCNYAPNVSEELCPPFVALRSVNNTTIEGIWHWLRKTAERNFIDEVHRGHNEGIFNPNDNLHISLFNWIWPPICQSVLDEFTTYWNNHRVHSQKNKLMPSGATPRDIFTSPQAYGGECCSIPVPQDAIDALQEALQFVDDQFSDIANQVWNHLGSPPCMVSSGWDIFAKMLSLWPHTNKEI